MLVQFDDDTGRLTPVKEPLVEWRYANFHIDEALVERYNRLLEEFEAVREDVQRIQEEHEVRRLQLGEEWANEKLAALERDDEVKWTTRHGKAAQLYVAADRKNVYLKADGTEGRIWLGYLPNGRDHVHVGLTLRFFMDMEVEWMQKLIAPPEGAQEV